MNREGPIDIVFGLNVIAFSVASPEAWNAFWYIGARLVCARRTASIQMGRRIGFMASTTRH